MKAMILAAGKGTRLLPLTEKVPKPMIRISSEPLIVHQIRWLKRGGLTDLVINLHHLSDQIQDYLGNGRRFGVSIQYSHEEELLETGGGIVKALPTLGEDPFLLLNGDIWTNYRFQSLPLERGHTIHLVLVDKPAERDHGDFNLSDYQVLHSSCQSDNHLVYCGIAYVDPIVFKDETIRAFSFRDTLYREIEAGRVTGERFDGTWIDIGTHEGLKQVRRLMI